MGSLENVVSETIENADKECARILQESRDEAEKLVREAAARGEKKADYINSQKEESVKQINAKAETLLRIREKEIYLNTRNETIDQAFSEFMKKLEKMDASKKKTIYQTLLLKARKDLENPRTVIVRADDVSLIKGISKDLDIREGNISGGLLLENREGDQIIDFSFESMADSLRSKNLKAVSDILFGD